MRDDRSHNVEPGEPRLSGSRTMPAPAVVGVQADARRQLPSRLTSFVGRERELAELARLAGICRLVTLTGPGGCGKSRLALELGDRLAPTFAHGAHVVSLAPVTDPTLVMSAIADVLGAHEVAGEPRFDTVVRWIGDREILLLLDNVEHLLAAGPTIADLLAACARLTVVATSREVLRLQGEQVFPVPSLTLPETLPDRAAAPTPGPDLVSAVLASEAGRLFVERARSVQPGFSLDPATAEAVAEICARLDGLPLALELAAARVRLLPPRAMVERLGHRLPLLTGGARDLPARQQALRDTIAWSDNLLDEADRIMFRRLAVFVGGWTLEAADAVGRAPDDVAGLDVLSLTESLVDKSLVIRFGDAHGEPRFGMLETIREYALERLEERGEAPALRRRHAQYLLTLAERAWAHFNGTESRVWLDRLQADHANLRAVLTWSMLEEEGAEVLPTLAGYLYLFWWMRGHWFEANGWLDRALALPSAPPVRYRLLTGAGTLAHFQSNLSRAHAIWSEAVDLMRASGDDAKYALALGRLGYVVSSMGDRDRARALCYESLALNRRLGDRYGIARSLQNVGHAARNRGDDEEAVAAWTESLQIDRAEGFSIHLPQTLQLLAIVAGRRGEHDRALALCNEALDLFRQRGDIWGVEVTLTRLGRIYQLTGSPDRVAALASEALPLARQLGNPMHLRRLCHQIAWMARSLGDPARATRLLGAVQPLRDALGRTDTTVEPGEHEAELAALRQALGDSAFEAAWAAGRAMSPEQAYNLAVEIAAQAPAAVQPSDAGAADRLPSSVPLSRREQEVAALVADGLSNPQIASRLGLSDRTIDAHLRNIMGKLDVTSRVQVAAWSVRHRLAVAPPNEDRPARP